MAGGGTLVLLSIFLWLMVYQNLPDQINGMILKPINTAGPIDQAVKVGAIAIGLVIIAVRWSLARLLLRDFNAGFAAFMGLALLSTAWSIEADTTLLRCATLAGIVLVCLGVALTGWNRQRFLQVALPPLMFILVASLLIGVISPESIIEPGGDNSLKNAWHGITFQKNQFGMTASVVSILCFHKYVAGIGRTFWSMSGCAIGLICLALSRSSTSLLATMLGMFFIVLMLRVPVVRQRYSTHVVIAIAAMILLYELAIQNLIPGVNLLFAPVASLTGKDSTFSARSMIWEIIKAHISAAPYLGTGYGAYWTMNPSTEAPAYIFMYLMQFYPTESHNGYLEVMNDLGWAGVTCLLAYLFVYIRQALQLMRFDRSQAVMYLALLFQQMVANLSESEWFSRSTICIVLILGTICLSRDLLEYRKHSSDTAAPVDAARPTRSGWRRLNGA